MKREILEIRNKALHLTLDDFADYLETEAKSQGLEMVIEMIEAVRANYRLIKQYYAKGVDDKMRDTLYDQLFKKTWIVSSHLLHYTLLEENKTYKQAYQQSMRLNGYGQSCDLLVRLEQDIAMASLDAEAGEARTMQLLDEQYKCRQQVFCQVYTSGPLSVGDADILRDAVLSDEMDTVDKQIIVSALLIAQQAVFDLEKFRILCDIAVQSTDLIVREKTFVAVILGMPGKQEEILFDEELDASFSLMMALPGMEKELAELQIQMLIAMNTSSTNKEMKNNIIPLLMKSRFANPFVKPTEEDKIDDILHPEKEEEEMEKMESYAREVRTLMKNGQDIFYSGFSQTKRYPMFYTLVNWFMPFYREHPALRSSAGKMPDKFLNHMASTHGFCDSDMYSFVAVFSQTYNVLPEDLRKMIDQGEAVPDMVIGSMKDPTNVRKLYLQQLYRFYTLFMEKDDFWSPFKSPETMFFMNRSMVNDVMHHSRYTFQIAKQLEKRGYTKVLRDMISDYAKWNDVDWLLLASSNSEKLGDNITALMMLTVAETIKPKDKNIKLKRIEMQMNHGIMPPMDETLTKMLDEAKEDDDIEKIKWLLARTYMLKGRVEMENRNDDADVDDNDSHNLSSEGEESSLRKAEKLLVELNSMNPDKGEYLEELVECCLMERRFEAVPNILKQVTEDHLTAQCYLNQGLAQIFLGRIADAVESLRHYCTLKHKTERADIRSCLRREMQRQQTFLPEVEGWFNDIEIVIDLCADSMSEK